VRSREYRLNGSMATIVQRMHKVLLNPAGDCLSNEIRRICIEHGSPYSPISPHSPE